MELLHKSLSTPSLHFHGCCPMPPNKEWGVDRERGEVLHPGRAHPGGRGGGGLHVCLLAPSVVLLTAGADAHVLQNCPRWCCCPEDSGTPKWELSWAPDPSPGHIGVPSCVIISFLYNCSGGYDICLNIQTLLGGLSALLGLLETLFLALAWDPGPPPAGPWPHCPLLHACLGD